MLIDTHCHLNFKAFKHNLDEVVNEAKKAGVGKIIVPGTDLETSIKAVELANQYPNIYAAVGIHPHHAKEDIKILDIEILREKLMQLARNKKVIAIGEVGLDYYQYKPLNQNKFGSGLPGTDLRSGAWAKTKNIQKELFILQIKIAHELKLPLIIHCRQASDDLLKLITNHSSLITNSGVFHCFDGNETVLGWGLKNNFYFGVTGNVTYNKDVQQAVQKIPLNNLVVETDAPFLTPEPLRSQKIFPNTPKNVKITASRIAKLKGDSFLKVTQATSDNAKKLFKL